MLGTICQKIDLNLNIVPHFYFIAIIQGSGIRRGGTVLHKPGELIEAGGDKGPHRVISLRSLTAMILKFWLCTLPPLFYPSFVSTVQA